MNDELTRLKALSLLQAADISSLLELVLVLGAAVRQSHPDLPDLARQFLTLRRKSVQTALESCETTHPAVAARLQELIDNSCANYPFGYDLD